jgi:hypothetical protein
MLDYILKSTLRKQCDKIDVNFKFYIKVDVHLVWQDAYPPAIYVSILEIRWAKQSVHGFFCTNACAPTISTASKVFGQNKVKIMKKYFRPPIH